jgi:hypothetical protein
LEKTSPTNSVRGVPAKPLTPEQKADAQRLKAAFKAWQQIRKVNGLPWAQDAIAEDLFDFGQSAMSQYLNGVIPLNPGALRKFCAVMQVQPAVISPSITEREIARAFDWIGVAPPDALAPPPRAAPVDGPGIRLTPEQKQRRNGKPIRKVR